MVIITFQIGADWFKANWVFRQLAEDVSMKFPKNREVNSAMERAQWYGCLALDDMEKALASRVIEAIQQVAEETMQGKITGWIGRDGKDANGHRMYVESMKELLDLIAADSKAGS
jgi:hypothetical protein